MTIRQTLSIATSKIPVLDAEVLLAHILDKDRSWIIAHDEFELSDQQAADYQQLIDRRAKHEPVAYLVGTKEFYGRDFVVNPSVMIPRPETELIIDRLKADFDSDTTIVIADVGTGSGILGITAALEFPNAQVTAVDVQDQALDVARQNKIKLDAHNVGIQQSNLLQYFIDNKIKPDAIMANLPYLTERDIDESPTKEDLSYEPQTALLADSLPVRSFERRRDDGLALIKQCSQQGVDILNDNGKIYFEMLPDQTHPFVDWIKAEKMPYSTKIFKDLAGKNRVVVLTKNRV